ncbi:MAG TPA: MFS transporter [Burkholderiales bacterium]|nr:MFS transporter [Burkholderiales bacterium]
MQQRLVIPMHTYAKLFADGSVRYLYAASVVGRLPIGMCGLAILLLVQGARGSFATAGATTGAYVAGLAIIAPALGRFIDRQGPRGVLLVCSLLFPTSLAAVILAVLDGAPVALVFACAAAAGASFPPITICMRTFLRQRFAEERTLATAYSVDSVLIEVMFIAGPMLVAVLVAVASAAIAVACAAACAFVGVQLFLRSAALREWRIERRTASSLLGPLAERRLIALVMIVACYAIAFGLTEIGVAAYAAEADRPALAGVFLGVMSAGSAFGGLAYGSRHWRIPLARQFSLTLAVMGVGLLPLALPWHIGAFGLFSTLGGIVMAPALIIQSMLVAKTARPEHATEAFTWATSALLAGVGTGMGLGGTLVEYWRSPAAFCAAAAAAIVAAGAAYLLREN